MKQIALDEEITQARRQIADIATWLFARRLTDAAGGNISVRVGEQICMTASYSGQQYHWQLQPQQVLVVDLDGNILDGEGEISREAGVHLALHKEFPAYGKVVIHCHARNIMVFAAVARSMPPVLEGTLKFGEIPVARYAPSHTDDLATYIVEAMQPQAEKIPKQAAGVIAPWHGLFTMGAELYATADAVERMDTNAYCILMGQMLGGSAGLREESAALIEAIKPYRT